MIYKGVFYETIQLHIDYFMHSYFLLQRMFPTSILPEKKRDCYQPQENNRNCGFR